MIGVLTESATICVCGRKPLAVGAAAGSPPWIFGRMHLRDNHTVKVRLPSPGDQLDKFAAGEAIR